MSVPVLNEVVVVGACCMGTAMPDMLHRLSVASAVDTRDKDMHSQRRGRDV